MSRFEQNGGQILQKHIHRLNELEGNQYDVVFNCTGLGAQKLCNDHKVVPIRGQIIKISAQWISSAYYLDYDTYIIPGFNGIVTLGGTRQYENYNLAIDEYDRLSILKRCKAIIPHLSQAKIIRDAVGLRPHRSNVRVEAELSADALGNSLKIVHNYGHGGYGGGLISC